MTPIEAAYESAKDRMPGISLADFSKAVEHCDVNPVILDGKMAGAVIVKGNEVHACILPWAKKRWFRRQQARILNGIIKKHGYAVTSATTQEGREFVERLGFVKSGAQYRKEVCYGH